MERWDGRKWSIQPTVSMTGGYFFAVSCTSATACTAVGGGRGRPLVERWNGQAWSIQPTPDTRGRAELTGVSCFSAHGCIAVGYGRIGHGHGVLIERWNGRKWSMLPVTTPRFGFLNSVSCVSARACTAVGQSTNWTALVERWNGRQWTVEATPHPMKTFSHLEKTFWLNSVSCTSARLCIAVGQDEFSPPPCGYGGPPCGPQPKPRRKTLAERWNGRNWSIQITPSPRRLSALNAISCTGANACTAVGGDSSSLAARWNGHKWSVQPVPRLADSNTLGGISCTSKTVCTAAGFSDSSPETPEKTLTLIER